LKPEFGCSGIAATLWAETLEKDTSCSTDNPNRLVRLAVEPPAPPALPPWGDTQAKNHNQVRLFKV
jgi:hypothetical protein